MGTIGSYAGLMLLIGYSSIGIFTSLSDNQIVAFILSVFLCFFSILDLKDILPTPSFSTIIAALECKTTLKEHGTGVIDREMLYFVSITILFLSFTVYNLKSFKF
jgi:ABC-2 type transport system permease protein